AGQDATFIYIAEFAFKDQTTMWFSIHTARYRGFTFDIAVGQVDGVGRDEIILAGGSFGVNEPVPIVYLWHNGTSWIPRSIHTGLRSGTTAPMFVNLDVDSTLELFIGGVGPIGHGSCYALDHVSDTTWTVLWADSSLRNTPLSVNAGMLDGQFIVAGANTVDRGSLDTLYTQLHVYLPLGIKLGIWQRDTASIQNFHFLDIDSDGRTNLVAPLISHLIPSHLAVYEYFGTSGVDGGSDHRLREFDLFQNYPNPFNSQTVMRYSLSTTDCVTMKVYNVLGEKVVTLVNEVKGPGTYTVNFDASHLPSGVYFYRFQTSHYMDTKKLILLR
ncbi:MAG: T9SS type A sorting domain-containing protein, partial [Ignavibacteriae bacterium]|nr:T9SS type A sorting domain-containing protein [Ignavibacteriota bacterium]